MNEVLVECCLREGGGGLINYNHNELCKWEVNSVKAEQSFFMSFKMKLALRGSGQTLY